MWFNKVVLLGMLICCRVLSNLCLKFIMGMFEVIGRIVIVFRLSVDEILVVDILLFEFLGFSILVGLLISVFMWDVMILEILIVMLGCFCVRLLNRVCGNLISLVL